MLVLITHVYYHRRVQNPKHSPLIAPADASLLSYSFHFLVYHVKILTDSTPSKSMHLNNVFSSVTKNQAHWVLLPAEGRQSLSSMTLGPISPLLKGYSVTSPKRKRTETVALCCTFYVSRYEYILVYVCCATARDSQWITGKTLVLDLQTVGQQNWENIWVQFGIIGWLVTRELVGFAKNGPRSNLRYTKTLQCLV
jgi:hypothetical protein